MPQQSAIFPIFLRAEYQDSTGLQRFQSDAQRVAQAAKREFQGVGAALDAALSRERNSSSSFDLGVDEMRQAAAAQEQVALAAREVAEATRRAALENGQFDASMSRATRAAFELANAEERASRELNEQVSALDRVQRELNQVASATDLVTDASIRGTNARGNVINSTRAERTAFVQLGQQMQDITIQAQLGTNAFQIFSQQIPQAAFALTGLDRSANSTKRTIGAVATFFSGPWGAAIFAATAVVGGLVTAMLEAEDATKKTEDSSLSLSEQLTQTSLSFEQVTQAIEAYNEETEKASRTSLQAAQAAFLLANAKLEEAEATREALAAKLAEALQRQDDADTLAKFGSGGEVLGSVQAGISVQEVLDQQRANEAALEGIRRDINDRTFDLAVEQARIQGDAAEAIVEGYANARQELRATTNDVDELREGLKRLNAEEQAALDALNERNSRTRSTRRTSRESNSLDRFADRSAAQVAQINDRFAEQATLIRQSAQASRQLENIVAEIDRRMESARSLTAEQRIEFEGIKDAADEAQSSIEAALLRPLEDVQRVSDQRLQVQALIAQGREDEAAALEVILQLQEQIGELTIDQRDEIQEIVLAERDRTREYEAQRSLLEQQADVVRTIRSELTSVLSGRETNFIDNIRQSLLDLQGARLFEDLLGPEFRSLEQELSGNTPQGRANARYTTEVERTATATQQVGNAALELASVLTGVSAQITGAANDNVGVRGGQIAGSPVLNHAAPKSGIIVNGKLPDETELATRTIKELADQMGQAIVEPLGNELEDVLGPQFAAELSTVLSGTLAGLIRGGTPGAVLGGLQGLSSEIFGKDSALTRELGLALDGAQTGTTVNAVSRALGLGGSSTGAQIGGAIGSALPIPGGDLVGALAGNFLSSILGGTPRGSATIGSVGGDLGITGVRGNSSSREDSASSLADDVLDVIDNIARQLGASVNAAAGSVSIGVRDDNLRVDTTGSGITKTKNGAINFGDDAEGAIRFATRDLIQDGVIKGLNDAENRLLQAGSSLEDAVQDVLDFRSVFDRLQQIQDPVGFALDQLNREFDDLIDLFERAGASAEQFADLEELYNLERAEALERANSQIAGPLQRLLEDLTLGDSGLSLRTRQANAIGEFDDLAARVAAGDTTAFDDFTDISQQLLEIERSLFGSTQSYFDRLSQITDLTEQAIADQTNVSSIAQSQPSPFDPEQLPAIDRSIDIMNADLSNHMAAMNENLILIARHLSEGISVNGRGQIRTENVARVANF